MDGYSIEREWTAEELAERLADLEYGERRRALEIADKIAASHYE